MLLFILYEVSYKHVFFSILTTTAGYCCSASFPVLPHSSSSRDEEKAAGEKPYFKINQAVQHGRCRVCVLLSRPLCNSFPRHLLIFFPTDKSSIMKFHFLCSTAALHKTWNRVREKSHHNCNTALPLACAAIDALVHCVMCIICCF